MAGCPRLHLARPEPPRVAEEEVVPIVEVEADAQAVLTSWPMVNPASRILSLNALTSPLDGIVPSGTGSCQIKSSSGTSGPR